MKRLTMLLGVMCLLMAVSTAQAQLKIDFTQTGDPVQAGFEGYFADHEQAATFTSQNYSAFGATITVTPTWAAGATRQAMQMIDRGGNDGEDTPDLMRDWIGTDNRQPGNPMTLTISGLPRGTYAWLSYHHDTDNQTGLFDVTVNDAAGSTTTLDIDISSLDNDGVTSLADATTFTTTIASDGTNPISFVFSAQVSAPTAEAFFVMNGFEVKRVSFAIAKAWNPSPADDATDVPPSVVLTWTPGDYAPAVNGHKVFLSDDLGDVTGGLAAAERGIVSDPLFDTAARGVALEYSTTYYWRVDEANVPGGTWDEGKVWSFTMEPYSVAIPGTLITATADSNDAGQGPENTINGSGLDVDDLHSTELTDMWLSASGAPEPAWIQYKFDRVYKLHQMLVWNHNSPLEPGIGFGVKDATVEYSLDGTNWTTLGTTHEFTRAPGMAGYVADTAVDFAGAAAKYVKITANSNWGSIVTQCGLSEVRFFYIPVRARQPDPAPGATGMDVDNVILNWSAGREAASHEVYLSVSEQAVIDETISPVSVPAGSGYVSYDTGELDLSQTYYWKVNEVNTAETPATWQGDVWDFDTQEYLVVEDFEDYNDFPPDRIFDTWPGGYTSEDPANGSTIGHLNPPFAEPNIVHGGFQSMPFYYDNRTATYSEATANVADLPIGQDWTKYGIKALSVWFHGDPNNDATEKMYVKLNGSKVTYGGNVNDLTRTAWQEWNIDLTDFGNVDLSNVTEIRLGFERIGSAGSSGIVYFDDIRLHPARCVAEVRQPGVDLNDDCVVDYLDLQIIANEWLSSGLLVTPQSAANTGLVAHYEFEGNPDDSVGTKHGVTTGGPSYTAGKVGQAIDLDGLNDYVFIDGSFQLPEYTMAVWFRCDGGSGNRDILSAYAPGVVHGILLELQGAGTLRYLHRYPLGTGGGSNIYTTTTYDDGAWYHAAIVKSATDIVLYVNGENEGSTPDTSVFDPTDAFGLAVGVLDNERTPLGRFFVGAIDDIRIYERALLQAEIASLAGRTEPFSEPFDLNVDGTVDFKDFAALADEWLDEQLWP